MRGSRRLRHDRAGFSAFYGAFAVLLAATLVFAAIAARGPAHNTTEDARSDRVAHAFLDTLLASTEPVTNSSLGRALSHLCPREPCGGDPRAAALVAWAGARAEALAAPLGADFLLVLAVPLAEDLSAGELAPRPGLAMSRAEAYHPVLGGFVSLTLFLEGN
ncbi:MAG TPA: hypothetical protein VGB42_00490 [Candidatus Thermoplasmatota archaeon]